jgi:hypothetical protein
MRELDEAIARKQMEVDKLRSAAAQLPQAEADLAHMVRTQQILAGDEPSKPAASPIPIQSQGTMADKIAAVIPPGGSMHVRDIVLRLAERGTNTKTNNVLNAIMRHQGTRFARTAPNTFAVIKENLPRTPYRGGELALTQ